MPSLDSVTFDSSALQPQREDDHLRLWCTDAGDFIGLHFFPLRPDIGADPTDIRELRRFYSKTTTAAGGALIDLETLTIDNCLAVRGIIKVPQQPSGMTYLGSITLPFQTFSFVVKIQAEERGTTGVRDTLVLEEALADGRVSIDLDAQDLRGWAGDPYDPSLCDGLRRNLSEHVEYDARFPDHPLSRVRQILSQLESSLRVDAELRRAPQFRFGEAAP